jgi:4,5-DOPA dioxygenase extradiol
MSTLKRLPVLFIGHGNPMNALAKNPFTQKLNELGKKIPTPRAILCISAHWMTEGTWITHMSKPKTIHDFYGFPKELSEVQYPAPGSPEISELIASRISSPKINLDDEMWGLDHGTWSVLKHMYPKAEIPIMQLSLHMEKPSDYHFQLGEKLKTLRDEGVLIVGSGNIVHNLSLLSWLENSPPHDWAVEFDEWVKDKIQKRDFTTLIKDAKKTENGKRSIPTPEHWYPLLYVLGASDEKDTLQFQYEKIDNASISMRTFTLGLE